MTETNMGDYLFPRLTTALSCLNQYEEHWTSLKTTVNNAYSLSADEATPQSVILGLLVKLGKDIDTMLDRYQHAIHDIDDLLAIPNLVAALDTVVEEIREREPMADSTAMIENAQFDFEKLPSILPILRRIVATMVHDLPPIRESIDILEAQVKARSLANNEHGAN